MRNDGISFATLTFTAKVMSALAVLVFGLVVVLAGYEDGVDVTPEMQKTVWIGFTLVPAVSCLLSAVAVLVLPARPEGGDEGGYRCRCQPGSLSQVARRTFGLIYSREVDNE